MTRPFIVALALVLCGCPGALLLFAAAGGSGDVEYAYPPNAGDYASWVGVPQVDLESHPRFALMPREVRKLSDGSALWILRFCRSKREDCCLYEFLMRDAKVASYRTAGPCAVNCTMRPVSQIDACEKGSSVPKGYGRSE